MKADEGSGSLRSLSYRSFLETPVEDLTKSFHRVFQAFSKDFVKE